MLPHDNKGDGRLSEGDASCSGTCMQADGASLYFARALFCTWKTECMHATARMLRHR